MDTVVPDAWQRAALRRAHGLPPAGSFIVLVLCGNDEKHHRKSLDVSLLAFKAVHLLVRNAFLMLRVVSAKTFNDPKRAGADRASAAPARDEDDSMPLFSALLSAVGLAAGSYRISSESLSRRGIFELYQAADVLLQPSKAEGFGLPILEAQLVGTPVVSTRFGAMADFTRYGIAVPPLGQPFFLDRGFGALPDLNGTVEALLRVHRGQVPESDQREAVQLVRSSMSTEAVVSKFEAILAGAKSDISAELADALLQSAAESSASAQSAAALAIDPLALCPETWGAFEPLAVVSDDESLAALLNGKARDYPSWGLLWDLRYEPRCDALIMLLRMFEASVRQSKSGRQALLMKTIDRNGHSSPTAKDISKGKIELIRAALIPASVLREVATRMFKPYGADTSAAAHVQHFYQALRRADDVKIGEELPPIAIELSESELSGVDAGGHIHARQRSWVDTHGAVYTHAQHIIDETD
uniref:Glycosyl transferase family 1 domain-containing protein n=1 Tax=Calcidiscus leptoporus TaxID=127549 RepID=A0A7S0P0C5_9EUKA